ncbi:hypothetical protein RRG08_039857 [Elysia crispata]|uniref:Uncharacterized protein n=1 Tax=Elysia crispata TaxID=231223 RepID=A0AAE0ZVT1_9GAST|nr:hypothetical protein RRG08_039857 [Elysia crispata]
MNFESRYRGPTSGVPSIQSPRQKLAPTGFIAFHSMVEDAQLSPQQTRGSSRTSAERRPTTGQNNPFVWSLRFVEEETYF